MGWLALGLGLVCALLAWMLVRALLALAEVREIVQRMTLELVKATSAVARLEFQIASLRTRYLRMVARNDHEPQGPRFSLR